MQAKKTTHPHKVAKLLLINVVLTSLLFAIIFEVGSKDLSNARHASGQPSSVAAVTLAQVNTTTSEGTADLLPPPTVDDTSGKDTVPTEPSQSPVPPSPVDSTLLPPPVLDGPASQSIGGGGAGAGAVNNCTGGECKFDNPLGSSGSLEAFLNKLLDVVILLGAIAVVFSIIWAGLKYVTANGDEKQISSAHTQLLWTLIGAGILLSAKVIAMIVQNTVQALK